MTYGIMREHRRTGIKSWYSKVYATVDEARADCEVARKVDYAHEYDIYVFQAGRLPG